MALDALCLPILHTLQIDSFRPADIEEKEYIEFYKAFSKDSEEPLTHVHFTAEGEVTFKSILYVPKTNPPDTFQNYGKKLDQIKVRT